MEIESVNVALALVAGVLSFASPCVLPLVPAYLGYITGVSAREMEASAPEVRRRSLAHAAAFVAGMAVLFTLLGATASAVGQTLQVYRPITTKVAGILIIVFGLHMAGLIRLPFLYQEKRVDFLAARRQGDYLGAAAMGAAFAVGWTPCVGAVLGSILLAASQSETVLNGMLLLFVYSLGLGLPFIAATLAAQRSLRLLAGVRRHMARVSAVGGALLVAMGMLVFTDRMLLLSGWFVQTFGLGLAI